MAQKENKSIKQKLPSPNSCVKKTSGKKTALIFGLIMGFAVLVIGLFSLYSSFYTQKIYPKITVAGIDVGGMEEKDALEILDYKINSVKNKDIFLFYEDKQWIIEPADFSLHYDAQTTIKTAYNIGRNQSFIENIINKTKRLFTDKDIGIAFSYDQSKFESLFSEIIDKIDKQEINASCSVADGKVTIVSEQIGQKIQLEELRDSLIKLIARVETNRHLKLPVTKQEPQIISDNIQTANNQAEIIIGQKISLSYNDKIIELSQKEIIHWLEFIAFYDKEENNYKLKTILNEEKIKSYIYSISNTINQKSKDARLTIANGKAVIFQSSRDGYELNQDQTLSIIVNTLSSQVAGISSDDKNFNSTTKTIKLPVDVTKPKINENNINNLGINELIASGTTNFRKSPKNRKHNIKIGAEIFHGALIKPDAVFSFNKVLGKVSAVQGFLPELVIKQDTTEPEIGGGLCQVSTTMFRVALNAGLPITERKNHKYRVSYYEPPVGLDATVYIPSPDLKFKNNTSKHILIQSHISGSKITFEFYGTKDGRTVHISKPELYDHKNPPPTRYIEDEGMEPGTEKYLERAHAGVKAKIFYQVKRNNEVIHEQTFYSKYVAWPAVIKRGPQNQEENQEENEENKEEGGD